MSFTQQVPEWDNKGTAPSDELKASGFQGGYKPPASVFNWFWNRVSACLKELQEIVGNGTPTLLSGTVIPANADLNTYTTVGNYYCPTDGTARELLNCPVNRSFNMRVFYAWGESYAIAQEIINGDTGVRYYRWYSKSAQVWTAWKHDYTTASKPTPDDIDGKMPVAKGGTGADTASAAANNLSVPTLLSGTAIPASSDLNTYTTVGNYRCATGSNAATLTNCPTVNAFIMRVFYANGEQYYIGQEIIDYLTGVRHYRMYIVNTNEWRAWQSDYTTANPPKFSDMGAAATNLSNVDNTVFANKAVAAGFSAPIVTAYSTDGAVYTATVDGVTELYDGLKIQILPERNSSTTAPKLNVNGTGEIRIGMLSSYNNAAVVPAPLDTWLSAMRPVELTFHQMRSSLTGEVTMQYWIVDWRRPSATSLYGQVPVQSGGWFINSNTTDEDKAEALENLQTLGAAPIKATATFDGLGWGSEDDGTYTQVLDVDGVTEDNTVIVTPAPEYVDNWVAMGCKATTQMDGQLEFMATAPQDIDMVVNVVIFN